MSEHTVSDGLVNVVANLGTGRDKAASSQYVYAPLNANELLQAYRGAWMPRAIVDLPAQDATRKWRSWHAEKEQIEAIEKLERKLGLRSKAEQCLSAARLYGGAAIYIATGDRDPSKALAPERVRDIRSLTVLTPQELIPDTPSRDIESPYYGKPERYRLSGRDGRSEQYIHASRLVVMQGASVPDQPHTSQGWGDSVLQSVIEAIRQMDSTSANIASLVFEAKVDVFKFDGFADMFTRPDGDAIAIRRLSAQAAMKGINGAVVIDAKDDYEPKSASFGGLDALMDRFANLVAGACRIPVTRLFGRASTGLSGSGDGDERVYFDRINHMQATEIEPAMALLDECLIWSALKSRPDEVYYRWNPLRQVTEKERADIFKTTADAARSLAGASAGELVPLDALSDSLVNELVEQGVLPGLDAKIDEYGSLSEQNDLPDDDIVSYDPEAITPAIGAEQ